MSTYRMMKGDKWIMDIQCTPEQADTWRAQGFTLTHVTSHD